MENQKCKNVAACPIFSGALKDKEMTTKCYKSKYCEAGESGWSTCKRYIVKEKTGKCPPNLMPNSFMEIDDIIKTMN